MHYPSPIFNLLVVLLVATQCIAQQNYLPATVVINGNTISGSIDYKDWSTGPFSITFKRNDEETVKNFTPKDIQSFTVNGDHYISSACKLDISPVKLDQLSRTGEQTFRSDTLFLKIIVHADNGTDLYYFRDEIGKEHFFYSDQSATVELIKFRFYNTAILTAVTINEYLNQLQLLTKDCPGYLFDRENTSFTKHDLKQVIESYNLCKGVTNQYVSKQPPTKKIFGISSGGSMAKISYSYQTSGGTGPYYGKADYYFDEGFTGGIFYEGDLPYNRESFWYCTHLYLHQFNSTGYYEGTSNMIFRIAEIQFNTLDTKIDIAIKGQTNKPVFNPFFKVGLTGTYSIINTNSESIIDENIYTGELTDYITENAIQKRDFHFGITGGAGISFKNKWLLEASYERGMAITDYNFITAFEDDLFLTLYYAF